MLQPIARGVFAFVIGIAALGVVGCDRNDSAIEKAKEDIREKADETVDKIDGEGPLQEAAEEIEEFGDKVKATIEDAEVEQRIDKIVADTKERLKEAGENVEEGAENAGDRIKEISQDARERIKKIVDSEES